MGLRIEEDYNILGVHIGICSWKPLCPVRNLLDGHAGASVPSPAPA